MKRKYIFSPERNWSNLWRVPLNVFGALIAAVFSWIAIGGVIGGGVTVRALLEEELKGVAIAVEGYFKSRRLKCNAFRCVELISLVK